MVVDSSFQQNIEPVAPLIETARSRDEGHQLLGFGSSDSCKRDFGMDNVRAKFFKELLGKEAKYHQKTEADLNQKIAAHYQRKPDPPKQMLGACIDEFYEEGRNGPEFVFDIGR